MILKSLSIEEEESKSDQHLILLNDEEDDPKTIFKALLANGQNGLIVYNQIKLNQQNKD